MSRKIAREVVMQFAYQMEINDDYSLDKADYLMDKDDLNEQDIEFIKLSISLLVENLESIDNKIGKYLKGWKVERIPKVDLAILRVAINEIDNINDVPDSVAINEAVDMAKSFSNEESFKFVNGLLGSYYRSLGE